MNNPEEIKIDADVIVAERLLEEVYYPANAEKLPLLLGLMRQTAGDRVLVFSNMRVTCDRVGRALKQQGYTAAVLSGDVPQQKREQLLNAFKEGKRQVLVATDVAARGLHIPSVSHVINYDLPQDAEDYVHRIGRTARAGASGHAISFACEDHAFSLLDIEQYIGHPLVRQEISEAVLERPVARSQTNSDKPRKSPAHERTPKRDEKASARPPRRERASQSNPNTTDRPRSEAKPATAAAAAPAPIPVAAKPEVVRRVQSSRHRPKVEVPAVG
jgi:ATP-dependent RNA helicase RhlB